MGRRQSGQLEKSLCGEEGLKGHLMSLKLTLNIGVGKGGPLVTREVLAITTLGMMAHTFNPSTQEAGAVGSL